MTVLLSVGTIQNEKDFGSLLTMKKQKLIQLPYELNATKAIKSIILNFIYFRMYVFLITLMIITRQYYNQAYRILVG